MSDEQTVETGFSERGTGYGVTVALPAPPTTYGSHFAEGWGRTPPVLSRIALP